MAKGKSLKIEDEDDTDTVRRFRMIQLCEKFWRTEAEIMASSSKWIDDCMEVGNQVAKVQKEEEEKQKKEREKKAKIDNLKRKKK